MLSTQRAAAESVVVRRRRRRTTITLTVLVLFLLGALGYAVAYFEGWLPQDRAVSTSTATEGPAATPTPTLPAPGDVVVNVYNATNRTGLAGNTSRELARLGFRVDEVANDPKAEDIPGVAVIRHGAEGLDAARSLRQYLPEAKLVEVDRAGGAVDLVLGERFTILGPAPSPTGTSTSPPAT